MQEIITKININTAKPLIMHVDLNSCFATIEQQANPLLRGHPVAVAAYSSDNGCILSPSIEAKKFGVKTGMRVGEGKKLCPHLIIRTPDPNKYRVVHQQFSEIFASYTPNMVPKSIDEAVLNFTNSPYKNVDLLKIGREIKFRMKKEIGEWIRCSVGIGPNRFLAKLASSLRKPDGLELIHHENLRQIYSQIKLIDLNGIGPKMEARLNATRIFTPLEFFEAPLERLRHQVFKSVLGIYWFYKLRGWEVDEVERDRKSFGHQYSLKHQTNNSQELAQLLMKLCEKTGRRLRSHGYTAQGVYVFCWYTDHTHWRLGKKFDKDLYATADIYLHAQSLLNQQPEKKKIRLLSVTCFELSLAHQAEQLNLFGDKNKEIVDVADKINDLYGEFTITPALMMKMKKVIIDRVAFNKAG